jgi:hypothetical protein
MSGVQRIAHRSVEELEAIVKEHIATGSAAGTIADIINEHFAPALEMFGKLVDKAANDAKHNREH